MDKDIVPDLLDLIEKSFQNKFKKDEKIKKLETLLFEKKSNHMSSNEYAMRLGDILSECYLENISEGILPNDTMYYNIAKRIIEPTLRKNYELVSTYASDTQTHLNRQAGLNIKGLKPEINQDRIDGIINRVSEDKFDKTKWVLKEPISNFTQAVVDDTVKTNAEFHSNLGLSPKIVRKEHGSCCDWCKKLVGSYNYDDISNTGNDVFRRHRHCRCTVEYDPGDGAKIRQDVYSKQWRNVRNSDKIEERKKLQEKPKTLKKDSIPTKGFKRGPGKNYPIKISRTDHVKFDSDLIENVTVFAGNGVSNEIRDAIRLETFYNQPAKRWQKVSGIAKIKFKNNSFKSEIHWYEANGKREEIKVKRVLDDES